VDRQIAARRFAELPPAATRAGACLGESYYLGGSTGLKVLEVNKKAYGSTMVGLK